MTRQLPPVGRTRKLLSGALFLLLTLAALVLPSSPVAAAKAAKAPRAPKTSVVTGTTTTFTFAPGTSADIPVLLYTPSKKSTSSQILVVMTGMLRNSDDYLKSWKTVAEQRNLVVVVPTFDPDLYTSDAYNLGNMFGDLGENPKEQWTWPIIDRLVDTVRTRTGVPDKAYSIWGHSAGGQFLTRFNQFHDVKGVEMVIAANPGWYTWPTDDIKFPYGLKNFSVDVPHLQGSMGRRFMLMLGQDDTVRDANLRMNSYTDAQGLNRLERGRNFFAASRDLANARGWAFNWRLTEVPGVGHSQSGMAAAAAQYLFPGNPA